MRDLKYLDDKGTFSLDNPDLTSYMYFPLANEAGMMSSITPDLNGDVKLDQNTFLMEPVSSENLHNNKSSRNFWIYVGGKGPWSATGRSAMQQAKIFYEDKEEVKLTAGIMWHQVKRISKEMGIEATITSFVPCTKDKVELSKVEIKNISDKKQTITPTLAVPIYGRSASNIRDHRHVTSLLHRTFTLKDGVMVFPTLTFDERGHNKNKIFYGVLGREEKNGEMVSPVSFCPVTEEFIGDGGSFENPYYVVKNKEFPYSEGEQVDGYETVGAVRFNTECLEPGETKTYIFSLEYGYSKEEIEEIGDKYLKTSAFDKYLEKTKEFWQKKINVSYKSRNKKFDNWMHWVNFQPMLRRIYGCSFLPHHDYGKGGRGWRDLWQDCLALLIMEPEKVRGMLIDNFGGVRMDGTNATIIGQGQGEFIADRNNITRVWMDHGAWPYLTTKLYMDQTGDIEFLAEENTYFKDGQICRGEKKDELWQDSLGNKQLTEKGECYSGTILEHLLIQHLTAFYDVGEHNHIRLRGADWNDGLDMADERGESVAFTAVYGGNLKNIAEDIRYYASKTGKSTVLIEKELLILLNVDKTVFDRVDEKKEVLNAYCQVVNHSVSGERVNISCDVLADILDSMGQWIVERIRKSEWIDEDECGWFNGYYDNDGNAVGGVFDSGVRMMLTGQVFTVMEGIATDKQVQAIVKASDRYLYDEKVGGYRLNTDFCEVKTNLGRLFGFAYGHKENGAVFSHMATMYANALYKRGFANEGFKVIDSLFRHCNDFSVSGIYPGVPEYVNSSGRGMYHYLTGAASWLLLTVLNEMFGIKGIRGDLVLEPKLLKGQFEDGMAGAGCMFNGLKLQVFFKNPLNLDAGEYRVSEIFVNGTKFCDGNVISKEFLASQTDAVEIVAVLSGI